MTQHPRLGQYELIAMAGQGQILNLYRAHDTVRNRRVTLTLVQSHLQDDADLAIRFRQRAEELLRLRHPRILPILDASFDNGPLYVVTDVPGGESLERRCAARGPLDPDDVLDIISPVADALDYAHEQGVFHHDIRPANIYVDHGTATLTGFFLLEAVGATATYLAPEQLDETSAEVADHRSDAYALGAVIYEALTGRPPFEGAEADVAAAHLAQRPLPPRVHNPDLFPAVDAILLKALTKQPARRYQRPGDLAHALYVAVQNADTRRMANGGAFNGRRRLGRETPYTSSSLYNKGGPFVWVWVGLGILLAVVIAVIILLATG